MFLHFTPNLENPRTGTYRAGEYEAFSFTIKDVQCLIRITSTDSRIPGHWVSDHWVIEQEKQAEWTCIVIARDHIQAFILHQLLLIKMQKGTGIAERATVLELLVPLENLDILEEFRPRRQRIVLV